MSLLELYREHIAERNFSEDPAQVAVIEEMQRIADELQTWQKTPQPEQQITGLLGKLFGKQNESEPMPWVKGLYCYGGVGRGKTVLMDLFVEYLPTERKRRRHFHRFMLEIHDALNKTKDVENPLDVIIQSLAEKIDILCLDEFFVSDITDAMLFVGLFNAMKRHGITMVTTSNIKPDDLYKDGLQRQRFVPAIDWIKENLVVHHITDGEDFRHRHFSHQAVFRTPDNEEARQAICEELKQLTGNRSISHKQTKYYHAGSRQIPIIFRLDRGIMFEFDVICAGNYSQKDYIDIAKRFPYVAVVGVTKLTSDNEDAAKRFLLMIDEFYDRGVKLLLTSNVPMTNIYAGKKLAFEFERLQSRLFEMQSAEYWTQPHLY